MGKKETLENVIKKANLIHNNQYDYSKYEFKNYKTPSTIICPLHGPFYASMDNHINKKSKCPVCAQNKKRTNEEFIEKATLIHGDLFNYSKVNYINDKTKVCIICPIHGEFWQTPNKHLLGQGCYACSKKFNIGENKLYDTLKKTFPFVIEREKHFPWLSSNKSIDFFFPQFNIAIECQGIQHFKPIDFFGGSEQFTLTQQRDAKKYEECQKNNIQLLYFSFLPSKMLPKQYLDTIYNQINELINIIQNIINKYENNK